MHEKYLDVDGIRTRFLSSETDHENTLLLLHDGAWGASAELTWQLMFPLMAQEFNVIAPDMPGFGGTDKVVYLDRSPYDFRVKHAVNLLDKLEVGGEVHGVGQSFGGSVLLRALTSEYSRSRLASVTSIAGTGGPWRTDLARQELGNYDGTLGRMQQIMDLLVDDYPAKVEDTKARMEWAKAPGHYLATIAPHGAVPEQIRVQRAEDPYPANLSEVQTPVLLIHGERDALVEENWVDNLSSVLPNATVETMPSKHSPNLSHPEETWSAIRSFISSQ